MLQQRGLYVCAPNAFRTWTHIFVLSRGAFSLPFIIMRTCASVQGARRAYTHASCSAKFIRNYHYILGYVSYHIHMLQKIDTNQMVYILARNQVGKFNHIVDFLNTRNT